jgi:hypothetical protein
MFYNDSHCCSESLSFPDLWRSKHLPPEIQEFAAHFNLEKELANEALVSVFLDLK